MKKLTALFVLFIFTMSGVVAQGDVISAADFMAAKKTNKSLVLIDANTATNYAKSHAQGAVNIPHKELYQEGEIEGLIKSPDELAEYFGKKGVSNANSIVIYDDGSNKYSSRVYWVLKYLGASDVKILHKDMDAWKKARVPLTRSKTMAKATTFTANVNSDIIVDMAFVKSNIGTANTFVVDCRDLEEFNGTSDKSEGHIKGSIHMNYKECVHEDGSFKSKEELEAVASKYGFSKDKTIVFYCVTSVRASAAFVAFNSILGYPNIKVYDGAYNEWVAANNPIE